MLDATPAGEALYRSFGFQVLWRLTRWRREARAEDVAAEAAQGTLDRLLQPANKDELASLVNYHLVSGRKTTADVGKWQSAAFASVLPLQLDEPLAMMVYSGALERHPGMRLVLEPGSFLYPDPRGPEAPVDEAAWDDVLDINLRGFYLMSRAVIFGMLERGGGAIVNTSSAMALMTEPGYEAYTTSKAGIIGMSKSLGQELASRGITVNCVAPGFIRSAMTDALNDAQKGAILTKIPAGDLGSGDDIGAAVVYLASREAGYVTGQTLHVNGGMAMI